MKISGKQFRNARKLGGFSNLKITKEAHVGSRIIYHLENDKPVRRVSYMRLVNFYKENGIIFTENGDVFLKNMSE